jgi:hypothetical protein
MDKIFFEKTFSEKRMEKYFKRYADADKAMIHYQCNIELAEAFYPCIFPAFSVVFFTFLFFPALADSRKTVIASSLRSSQ